MDRHFAVTLEPEFAVAYERLALVRMGEAELCPDTQRAFDLTHQAVRLLETALAMEPSARLYARLSLAYTKRHLLCEGEGCGERGLDLAILLAEESVKLMPEDPEGYVSLGMALLAKSEFLRRTDLIEPAIHVLSRALALDPLDPLIHGLEGVALLKRCLASDNLQGNLPSLFAAIGELELALHRLHPAMRCFDWFKKAFGIARSLLTTEGDL